MQAAIKDAKAAIIEVREADSPANTARSVPVLPKEMVQC